MKIVKKILLGLLAAPLVLLAVVVVVQTYYHLKPVVSSAAVLELNMRAAKLPVLTENGYRLYGLFAPREQDAAVFGKCLVDGYERHKREDREAGVKAPSFEDKPAWEAYEKWSAARVRALDDSCLKSGTRLTLPKALTDIRVNLATTADQWQALATVAPDETVLTRAEAVRSGGVRRLGAAVDSPFPSYDSLMKLERWRIARGVVAWRNGDRPRAVGVWTASIADWTKSANSTLIEAVMSVAAQTQVLIAIQGTVARSERMDNATTDGLLAALKPIEAMPDAVADSLVAEWQMHANLMKQVAEFPAISIGPGLERNVFERAMDRVGAWMFDHNGTLNEFAKANLWSQDALRKTARGGTQPEYPVKMQAFGCAADGEWGMACLPFIRNPAGRVLSAIATPAYASYGTRVADLRNLAAATRLTIEARHRALLGDALVQFIANAPEDMRDVFSGRAFVYDVASKCLRVELHEKSTILGEKGATYELRL